MGLIRSPEVCLGAKRKREKEREREGGSEGRRGDTWIYSEP